MTAPVIFRTVVHDISSIVDLKHVGRVGIEALANRPPWWPHATPGAGFIRLAAILDKDKLHETMAHPIQLGEELEHVRA